MGNTVNTKIVKQYYVALTKTGAVQMIYRMREESYNDGTTGDVLEYISSRGVWMGSMNSEKVLKTIVPLTESEAEQHIFLWKKAYSL